MKKENQTISRYAIRHIPTGGYLYEVGPRLGYTGTEPVTMQSNFCPRLFAEKGHAKRALTWWLKGVTTKTYHRGDGWETDDDEVWATIMPKSDQYMTYVERKAEDFEIVRFYMMAEITISGEEKKPSKIAWR